MIRLRHLLFLGAFGVAAVCCWTLYTYMFDISLPIVMLHGVEPGAFCAGDINCILESSKKGEVAIWLDDKLLTEKHAIHARDKHAFAVPTKTIANGQHNLRVEVVDTAFSKNKAVVERSFVVDNSTLQAVMIKTEEVDKVFQGRTLHVQIQVNKEIHKATVQFLSAEYECFPESKNSLVYEAFVPIQCEEMPNEYSMVVAVVDKVGNTLYLDNKVQVVVFPFKKHTLNVSDQKMQEEEALGPDNKKFEDTMAELAKNSPREKLWKGAFCAPMDIAKITCEFGTIRTTQRKGRYAHRAIDAINLPRSVVWAPQNGIVVLKERYAYTGNTVVIDHGWGLLSMFCHLEDFSKITVGEKIAKGNPIGTMGKTGYATGYHLHWEMRINNIPVDPLQWTKATF